MDTPGRHLHPRSYAILQIKWRWARWSSLTIHLTVKPETLPSVVSYDIVDTSGKVLRRLNEGISSIWTS